MRMSNEDLSFFEDKEFKENLARYESMLQSGSSAYLDADELTDIAEYYMQQQQMEKADACIQYALQLHPGSTDPLIFIARQKMFAGDYKGAKAVRDSISDTLDREVFFLNAELLLHEGTPQEATDYLERQEVNIEDEDKALFLYDSAYIFIDYGAYREALKWADRYVQLVPDSKDKKYLYAEIYSGLHVPETAKHYINQVLDENPYDIKFWLFLSEMQRDSNEVDEALESCDIALAIEEDNPQAMIAKTALLLYTEDYQKSHELMDHYIKVYPDDELGYLYKGATFSGECKYEAALPFLVRAKEIAEKKSSFSLPFVYVQLSYDFSEMHREEEAIRYLSLAYEINGNEVEYLVEKGHIHLKCHKLDKACQCYMEATHKSDTPYETLLEGCIKVLEAYYYDYVYPYLRLIVLNPTVGQATKARARAYLGLCCRRLYMNEQFLHYLKMTCDADDRLAYEVYRREFPSYLLPEDYYEYAYKMIKEEEDYYNAPSY